MQRRQRLRGRHVITEFSFYQRNSLLSRSVQYTNVSENALRLNMVTRKLGVVFKFLIPRSRTWSFHVLVKYCRGRQRNWKRCTVYSARAQLLFCSLSLLFGAPLAAVVVVVWLTFPSKTEREYTNN